MTIEMCERCARNSHVCNTERGTAHDVRVTPERAPKPDPCRPGA